MAIYLALKDDCSSIVTDLNPISTKHTSNGDSKTVPVYIANDGKRKNVPNDTQPPKLLYTNIQVRVEGVAYKLGQSISPSTSDTVLTFDSVAGWNIGTIIQSGTERMRIEEILTDTSVRVQRDYKSDGGSSIATGHQIGANFVAENKSVSLALPDPDNYNNPGSFLNGGESLTVGLDPTKLTLALGNQDSATTVRSSDATKYSVGCLIRIDNEIMKVTEISGNNMTVIRGYNDTQRVSHNGNAIIYCVGIVDINVAHKIFIKNSRPAGLPTQKKADVRISVMADEEPA